MGPMQKSRDETINPRTNRELAPDSDSCEKRFSSVCPKCLQPVFDADPFPDQRADQQRAEDDQLIVAFEEHPHAHGDGENSHPCDDRVFELFRNACPEQ